MKAARGMTDLPASRPQKVLLTASRILLMGALVLFVLILAGTLFAVCRGSGSGPLVVFGAGKTTQVQSGGGTGNQEGAGIFTGIGRLRIPVAAGAGAGTEKATLVLSIAFPYPPGDRAFAEELASRVGDFRRIATDYFSSRSADELRNSGEDSLKAELLRRYNAILRLGNIRTLYFNDLMIFD